jgi:multimeric flavodoxin WrbA
VRALAINGSPHMDKGNTDMILSPFLQGMKEAGADVELLYTKKLKIEPCNGDMSCWSSHPGECGMKDDMSSILPKISQADILVWASPVYYAGISGPLKNLMDRQLPLHAPGSSEWTKKKAVVLVSTCGDWKIAMFEPLLVQMRELYKMEDGSSNFVGALLRPHAEVMKEMIKAGETRAVGNIFEAAREAGKQLINEGMISEQTLSRVSKALISEEVYDKAVMGLIKNSLESAKRCD